MVSDIALENLDMIEWFIYKGSLSPDMLCDVMINSHSSDTIAKVQRNVFM